MWLACIQVDLLVEGYMDLFALYKVVRLERNVVFSGRRRVACVSRRAAPGIAVAARSQETNRLGVDFERSAGSAVLLLPDARPAGVFIGGQTSLDEHLRALLEVLVADLGLLTPGRDAEPNRLVDLLAVGRGVLAVAGNRERSDGLS